MQIFSAAVHFNCNLSYHVTFLTCNYVSCKVTLYVKQSVIEILEVFLAYFLVWKTLNKYHHSRRYSSHTSGGGSGLPAVSFDVKHTFGRDANAVCILWPRDTTKAKAIFQSATLLTNYSWLAGYLTNICKQMSHRYEQHDGCQGHG